MSEGKDSFVFYRSFYEALQDLNDKDRLKLYDATCNLALNGEDTNLKGIAGTVFKLIKPQVMANTKRYVDGKKGGRPKKETTGYKNKKTTGFETEETTGYDSKKPNVNENVNENVNVNENDNVLVFFEDEFARTLSPLEIDLILQWEKEHGEAIVKLALKEAVKHNAKNMRYIEVILNNWKSNGLQSEAEALAYMAKREKEIQAKKAALDKQLPDWYYNQDVVQTDNADFDEAELERKMKALKGE